MTDNFKNNLGVIEQAIDAGLRKGVYGLQDSVAILNAITSLTAEANRLSAEVEKLRQKEKDVSVKEEPQKEVLQTPPSLDKLPHKEVKK